MATNPYKQRIKRVTKELQKDGVESALLVSSAPHLIRSRDTSFEFRQNSDFYYLTGSRARDCALLVTTAGTPLLFVPKPNKVKILWEGKQPRYREIAEAIGAELIVTSDVRAAASKSLAGIETLYFQNTPDSIGWSVASGLMSLASHERGSRPARFHHSDLLLENMRLFKTKDEVRLIKKAAAITNVALWKSLPIMQPGRTEAEVANAIEFFFRMHGAEVAFPTIAASGPSAATLHYEARSRTLRKGEMLLIDCGAEYEMYAGDITRMVPIGGSFEGVQKEIYSIVLESQLAALAKVKHGVKIADVYNASAKVMTEGLVHLRVLRGKLQNLMTKRAFRPFFPHGIGHSLGIDVHDVGKLRGNNEARLLEGMVFTIEPGLYFPRKIGKIPACGVRIEDDVLVTKKGCEVLSGGFPKEPDQIEELIRSVSGE